MEDNWKTVVKRGVRSNDKKDNDYNSNGGISNSNSNSSTTDYFKSYNYEHRNNDDDRLQKINQPCWFFNTGGCKNKNGTDKKEEDCRYLHIISPSVTKPIHINPSKPCDKHNLEGFCKFGEYCKYSHRNLTQEEWSNFYSNIPYNLKTNNQKRQMLELKLREMDSRINILEYKLKSMDEHYEDRMQLMFGMIQNNNE